MCAEGSHACIVLTRCGTSVDNSPGELCLFTHPSGLIPQSSLGVCRAHGTGFVWRSGLKQSPARILFRHNGKKHKIPAVRDVNGSNQGHAEPDLGGGEGKGKSGDLFFEK